MHVKNNLFEYKIRFRDGSYTSIEKLRDNDFKVEKRKDELNLLKRRNKVTCACIKNTDILIELLGIIEYIDINKTTCNRKNCIDNIRFKREKFLLSNGWSRYPIKLDFLEQEYIKSWHISYHGTTYEAIKNIVKEKKLVIPNNKTVHIRQGHIPNQFFIFTSPSLLYASFGLYSAPFRFKKNKKWWQIVVELAQKPNSYIKEWETSGLGTYNFDENIGNNELEWKSDQETGNLVTAVLIREIDNIEPPICQYPAGTYFLHEENWWYQPYDGSTPFCPKEICSDCVCYLQRGARLNGSICPLSNYENKQFDNSSFYRFIGKFSKSNSFKIVENYKLKNIKLNNINQELLCDFPVKINRNLDFKNEVKI